MNNYRRAFFLLLLITTIFRLFYIHWLELAPDEAYYWTWSKQLQWGYYDHPPMVAFLIWIGTAIGGNGEFGVRLVWVGIGALLSVLLYWLGKRMFASDRAGFYAALLMNLCLLASTGAVIVTPDGPQGLFWVLALLCVFQVFRTDSARWWYGAGISLGLGLLSKYTMVLFAPCVFLFLLSFADGRKWLGRKEPYLALVLGVLIFLPVVYWNYQHDWISFRFQLSHGLEVKRTAGLKTFGDFWGGQAGVISPFLFLALLWAMFQSARRGFRERNQWLLLLFWTSAPVLFFFALTSLRSKVEANWPALAYFPAVVALAGIAADSWARWGKGKKRMAWTVVISAFVVTAVAHVQPLYSLIPISPQKDPTTQLLGWRSLGERIQQTAQTLDPAKGIFILAPRHQFVGESMFYTRGKIRTYQWDAPMRINHLSVLNAPPVGSQAIYFSEGGNDLPPGVASLFSSCERLDPLIIKRNSIPARIHPLWKCTGFKGMQCALPPKD
jgi:4-amino-4-deoxy-L-arabinose transferase-like glycosyltransferase